MCQASDRKKTKPEHCYHLECSFICWLGARVMLLIRKLQCWEQISASWSAVLPQLFWCQSVLSSSSWIAFFSSSLLLLQVFSCVWEQFWLPSTVAFNTISLQHGTMDIKKPCVIFLFSLITLVCGNWYSDACWELSFVCKHMWSY